MYLQKNPADNLIFYRKYPWLIGVAFGSQIILVDIINSFICMYIRFDRSKITRFEESNWPFLYGSQKVITYLQLCPLNLLKMEKHPFCQFLLKFEFWLVSCSAYKVRSKIKDEIKNLLMTLRLGRWQDCSRICNFFRRL